MQVCDKIYAIFKPVREDDLRPGVAAWIGRACIWQAYWEIENGPYKGQWAMVPDAPYAPFGWVPSGDLVEITLGN